MSLLLALAASPATMKVKLRMREEIKQINFSDISRINYNRPIHLSYASPGSFYVL